MKTLGGILVKLGLDLSEFDKNLKTATKKFDEAGKNLQKIGTALSIGVSAPLTMVGKSAIQMAMNAVESENLFTVAMGEMAESTRQWSEEVSRALGLNEYEVRKNIGTFYQMLKSMGLGAEGAGEMSKQLTTLAYDMASFYNLRPEEAFQKLQSGIVGNIEPLRSLGVLVHENTIQAWALRNGMIKQGETMTEQQKVIARFNVIMEQTKNAQGDLARTIESPTNQMRIMKEQVNKLLISLGMELLPVFQSFLGVAKTGVDILSGAVKVFSSLPPTLQNITIGLGVVTVALGPATFAFGSLLRTVSAIVPLLPSLVGGLGKVTSAMGTVGISATAVGGAFVILTEAMVKHQSAGIEKVYKSTSELNKQWEVAKKLKEMDAGAWQRLRAEISATGDISVAMSKAMAGAYGTDLTEALKKAQSEVANLQKEKEALRAKNEEVTGSVAKVKSVFEQLNEQLRQAKTEYASIAQNTETYTQRLIELNLIQLKRNEIETKAKEIAETLHALQTGRVSLVESEIELTKELNAELALTNTTMAVLSESMGWLNQKIAEQNQRIVEQATPILQVREEWRRFGQDLHYIVAESATSILEMMSIHWTQTLGQVIAGTRSWSDAMKDIFSSLKRTVIGAVADMISAYIRNVVSQIAWAKAGAIASAVASLFKTMPWYAALAMAGGVIAGVSALFSRIRLAEGGLVTKPTRALIGEREPEFVIPLSKFQNMFQSSAVKVEIQPVVIPLSNMEGFLIEFIQKASKDERLIISKRSIK